MIKKIEDLNFYELLEISPTATSQEIHKAYERIRRVYEPNSVALYSLFSPEETAVIQQRIEEAYRTLVYEDNRRKYDAMLRDRNELPETLPPLPPQPKFEPQPIRPRFTAAPEMRYRARDLPDIPRPRPQVVSHQEMPSPVSQLIAEFTGPAIKLLREQKGLTLRNIADITKVSARYLELIEEENFQKLPARAYIRGFVMLYAKALDCNAEKVAGDYLKRYDAVTGFPHALRKKSEG
jgi:curved DNA-binding protein CbpA